MKQAKRRAAWKAFRRAEARRREANRHKPPWRSYRRWDEPATYSPLADMLALRNLIMGNRVRTIFMDDPIANESKRCDMVDAFALAFSTVLETRLPLGAYIFPA